MADGPDGDAVFRALADPTRRALLDRLREQNGQTLTELCRPLNMARQSATQHLGVLGAANLITTVRRGRARLHYLNPVPLWDIERRWIGKFERPRRTALSAIKDQAEHEEDTVTAQRPDYGYVTYIESSPERVWQALTSADLTRSTGGTATSPTGSRAQAGHTAVSTAPAPPTWSARSSSRPRRSGWP